MPIRGRAGAAFVVAQLGTAICIGCYGVARGFLAIGAAAAQRHVGGGVVRTDVCRGRKATAGGPVRRARAAHGPGGEGIGADPDGAETTPAARTAARADGGAGS